MPELSPAYTETRETLLAVAPDAGLARPDAEPAHVYGLVADIGFEMLFTIGTYSDGATTLCGGDGTTITGLGDSVEVAVLSRGLLRQAEANLAAFAPVGPPPLPAYGKVRFTVLTYAGRLGAELDGSPLLKGEHALSPLFAAVMAIMERARQQKAQAGSPDARLVNPEDSAGRIRAGG